MKNITNELTIRQEKDKFVLRRIIEDEFDAEEFLRQGTQIETAIDQVRSQIKVNKELNERRKKELKLFNDIKEAAQKVRMAEIEKAKEEREKALEKEEKAKGLSSQNTETTNDNS